MSIELELRLEGEDANEDTLLDLMDWLKRANIEADRKESPPDEGDMGLVPDVDTIITILQGVDDCKALIEYLETWYQYNNVMICPKLQAISEKLQENDSKIKAIVEQIRTQFCKDK